MRWTSSKMDITKFETQLDEFKQTVFGVMGMYWCL